MKSAVQLPLDKPTRTPRKETYRGISVTARECKNPALRGKVALDAYTGTPRPPRYLICHPDDAAAIGAEVDGVLVVATGKARNTYLLGPIDTIY